jgi:hypothetical protein
VVEKSIIRHIPSSFLLGCGLSTVGVHPKENASSMIH